jgi:uncharacterized protein (TIGR02145 family)
MMTKHSGGSLILKSIAIGILFIGIILVGCSKDHNNPFKPKSAENTGTVKDIDGNTYKTVKIGDQWWMAENLKTTHYRNGDAIPAETDSSAWSNLSTGAYCNSDNDEANVEAYGRLYNWFTVIDSRNLTPAGWHVPSDEEWKQLEMYLGMSREAADQENYRGTDEGGKLKETGTTHWHNPNEGATNETGFSAFPGGSRDSKSNFNDFMGYLAAFWSSTEGSDGGRWFRYLPFDGSQIGRSTRNKRGGGSIRCIRD